MILYFTATYVLCDNIVQIFTLPNKTVLLHTVCTSHVSQHIYRSLLIQILYLFCSICTHSSQFHDPDCNRCQYGPYVVYIYCTMYIICTKCTCICTCIYLCVYVYVLVIYHNCMYCTVLLTRLIPSLTLIRIVRGVNDSKNSG